MMISAEQVLGGIPGVIVAGLCRFLRDAGVSVYVAGSGSSEAYTLFPDRPVRQDVMTGVAEAVFLQREVREQCDQARFVAMDSMNLWIEIERRALSFDNNAI